METWVLITDITDAHATVRASGTLRPPSAAPATTRIARALAFAPHSQRTEHRHRHIERIAERGRVGQGRTGANGVTRDTATAPDGGTRGHRQPSGRIPQVDAPRARRRIECDRCEGKGVR